MESAHCDAVSGLPQPPPDLMTPRRESRPLRCRHRRSWQTDIRTTSARFRSAGQRGRGWMRASTGAIVKDGRGGTCHRPPLPAARECPRRSLSPALGTERAGMGAGVEDVPCLGMAGAFLSPCRRCVGFDVRTTSVGGSCHPHLGSVAFEQQRIVLRPPVDLEASHRRPIPFSVPPARVDALGELVGAHPCVVVFEQDVPYFFVQSGRQNSLTKRSSPPVRS